MRSDLGVHVVTSITMKRGKRIDEPLIVSKRDTHMVVCSEGFVTTRALT